MLRNNVVSDREILELVWLPSLEEEMLVPLKSLQMIMHLRYQYRRRRFRTVARLESTSELDFPRESVISGENLITGAVARRMIDRECYLLVCLIVFMNFVPCYSHERLFDGKTLYAGKELWKETLPFQSGSRVYRLEGLKSNSWYEVKISYPASIPALFSLQLLRDGEVGLKLNQMRRLLNTEKLIFKSESFENKEGLYVLVTVEPEGIVAIPNFKERSFIIYNIGKFFFLLTLSSIFFFITT
ncbi:hypothetical protein Bca101_076511 [Brassica carinata]